MQRERKLISKPITISNKLGLHARASTKLVNLASRFSSESTLSKGDTTVNCKSIMGIMMLAASQGTQLNLSCDGGDEEKAMTAIEALIEDKFGESE